MKTMMNARFMALALAIACGFALSACPTPSQAQGQEKIVIDGSTTVGPIAKAFAEYYMSKHPEVNVTVSESGSGNGATSLINGACQIATMSRFMKDEEFKAAVGKGVFPVAHAIAVDGVAIVVHPSNPIQELKIEQVRGIYTGAIKNWKELGGPDVAIVRVNRDTNSGTFETFESLVMNKEKITPEAETTGSNGAMRQRVASTPGAIGYVGLGFLEGVKALKINGVAPNAETVASGQYPVSRALFMFTNGYPKLGSHLYEFITLCLAPKGQEIIQAKEFVPLTKY